MRNGRGGKERSSRGRRRVMRKSGIEWRGRRGTRMRDKRRRSVEESMVRGGRRLIEKSVIERTGSYSEGRW